MLTFCIKYRKKKTENLNIKISKTKNAIIIMQSKYAVCGSAKSRLVKGQKAKTLLSSLGLKTRLNKIPLVGDMKMNV